MCLWCAEKLNWNKTNKAKQPDLRIPILDGNQTGRFRCIFEGIVGFGSAQGKAALVSNSLTPEWSSECFVQAGTTFYTGELLFILGGVRREGDKAIERTALWKETRLILSESHMFQGFRVCTQSKNIKLQTQCLKISSAKHLSLAVYLGLLFSENQSSLWTLPQIVGDTRTASMQQSCEKILFPNIKNVLFEFCDHC